MSWQTSDPGAGTREIPVEVGDILAGKYRVERILGAGGMGVVVSGRHVELGELRAIKFLHRELIDSSEVVERFLREARATVKLKSRYVVQVHDVGRFDTGEPFIVMEHLDGEDVDALIERPEPVPVETCIDIVMQALAAMASAHAAGIIHRDLKPGNLFVTRDDDGEVCVKVLDFGISKLREPGGDQNMRMTATDAIMGTPYYMSPEQMMSTRDVDERADIWSIGVVLYELLSGELPFKGNNIAAQCRLLLQSDPPPPSTTTQQQFPPGMEKAIVRFLLRDIDERYADVLEAAEALAEYGGPASARALEETRRALSGRRSAGRGPATAVGDAAAPAASRVPSMGHISRPALDKDSGGVSHPGLMSGTGPGVGSTAMGQAATLAASRGDEAMSRSTKASWQTMSSETGTSRRGLWGLLAGVVVLVVGGTAVAVFMTLGDPAVEPSAAGSVHTEVPTVPSAEPAVVEELAAAPAPSASATASVAAVVSAAPVAKLPVAKLPVAQPPAPPATAAAPPTALFTEPPPATTKTQAKPKNGDPFGKGRF